MAGPAPPWDGTAASGHEEAPMDDLDLVPLGDPPGSVLAGTDPETGQAWAFKVLPEGLDRRTRAEVEAELKRLAPASATAPLVVADRIVELPGGRPALRRELLAQSLPELLAAFGPLSVPDTLALGSALAEALDAAGTVHGGVTPGNVLFRASGEPVLTDFGVALRRAYPPEGDPSFRAPETIRDGIFDEAADRYGLGAILHLALTGKAPFARRPGEADGDHVLRVLTDPPPTIDRDDVPAGLSSLVTALLSRDPDRRPSDPGARLARPGTPAAMPSGKPLLEFGPQRSRRRPGPPVLAGAAVAALVAVVTLLLLLNRPRDLQVEPVTPPAAASGPAPSAPASARPVLLELADPIDQVTVVELHWTSSEELDFAVIVKPEGEKGKGRFAGRVNSYRVEVDPALSYCFTIRGTNGGTPAESATKGIRGANCGG
jgi:eukaryotic-like serine/threonine-protein kinase